MWCYNNYVWWILLVSVQLCSLARLYSPRSQMALVHMTLAPDYFWEISRRVLRFATKSFTTLSAWRCLSFLGTSSYGGFNTQHLFPAPTWFGIGSIAYPLRKNASYRSVVIIFNVYGMDLFEWVIYYILPCYQFYEYYLCCVCRVVVVVKNTDPFQDRR